MRDPTARSEYVLAYCTDCHSSTQHWRVRERTYRCMQCTREQDLHEADHDRDGLIS